MLGRSDKDKGKIAIIVGQPTELDDADKAVFGARLWHILDDELGKAGLDRFKLIWAYAQPCRSTEKVSPGEEKRCHIALIDYLEECGVEYALLVGVKALRIFTNGKVKALTKNRGTIVRVDTGHKIAAVPVFDYMDVLRDRELEDTFKADLAFFKRLTEGAFETPNYRKHYNILEPFMAKEWLLRRLKESPCVAYDLETEGLDYRKGRVKMLGLAYTNDEGIRWTGIIYPEETPFPVDKKKCWTWAQINELFQAMSKTCAHNSKFDNGWLQSRGVDVHCNFDTLLASYLEKALTPHSLKFLSMNELKSEWYAEGIDHDDLSKEMMKKMEHYCQLDCYFTLVLREQYLGRGLCFPHLDTGARYTKPLAKLLMPGTRVLERIEAMGVHVPKDKLEKAKEILEWDKGVAKRRLDEITERDDINYDSPTQLRKLLYGKKSEGGFGYKPIYIGKDVDPDEDDPTTGKAALKKLARDGSEFARVLLEYRGYAKGLSGFIEPWSAMLDENQRLYPQYNLGRTATGRLSCNNPNLQQVSRDKLIRNLITATPGYKFIEADYSQVELRVAAWLGRIESMKRIYASGGDIHLNTGASIARLNGIDLSTADKATIKSYRQRAKSVNFGYIYGMGAEGFMDYADASYDVVLTKKEAEEYRRAYFALYPELLDWHDRVRVQVMRDKYITTPFGRLRPLPNIDSIDEYLIGKSIRCGINTPVQSAASDLTLLSMVDLEAIFETCPTEARLVGQCHDAIFFEVREDCVGHICPVIQHTMTNPRLSEFDLYMDVPLEVEIKIGDCWGDPNAVIYEAK